MNRSLKQLPLAIACVAAACAANAAFAAQPVVGTPMARTIASAPISVVTTAPGTLMSMQGTANVELGTATTFSFTGSGHCKLTLNTDDGSNSVWEGELPFSQGYTYSSTSMNSYDQFKDYKTTVTPSGNCKKGAGPFGVTVRITNSHAQSLSGTPLNSPVSVSNVAKLGALGPAVTASGPARAASLPIGGASIQVK